MLSKSQLSPERKIERIPWPSSRYCEQDKVEAKLLSTLKLTQENIALLILSLKQDV